MKTIKFYTAGCKVNQYDTQNIREQYIRAGFKELEDKSPADAYVINTCTVTQRADRDSLNFIRRAKQENPRAKIIVTGCLAELDEYKIKSIAAKGLIVKNKDKQDFAERTRRFLGGKIIPKPKLRGRFKGISYFKGHIRAFLKIQDGCDNFCSYCKVPLVRGAPRSKLLADIILEARRLVENGVKEIVLCGICLGAYGVDLKPRLSLVDVLDALEEIEGLARIRLSSIEAGDVSGELISRIVQSKKLCRHLHIPIQSGDDKVLKMMNRGYKRADYLRLIKKIKIELPFIAITTDVLVGFPGEDETNFQNTVNLIKRIVPLKAHIFPYSKREGTFAATSYCSRELDPVTIKQRADYLKNIAGKCSRQYKKQFLNKKMCVLFEGRSKAFADFWEGYTDNYIKVLVKSGANLENRLVPARLKKMDGKNLYADNLYADLC
ncbi:MAG: tRNA (N(6)-L-threonylcarbamoyladenosine(37)-C(2))-methylthiotransferase MtaB [Candidatus Omnitrophota bacterium]